MTAPVFICINGCYYRNVTQDDPFRSLYDEKITSTFKPVTSSKEQNCITFSAHQMPLGAFCRIVSDYFSVGVVFSDKLQDKRITAEFKDTDLNTVFTFLSRQLGVDLVKVGNTFYLGDLKDEDKGILIKRVLSQDNDNLQQILNSLMSNTGKGRVLSGRIVLVSDNDFVIRRISEALDSLETVDLSSWILQLYFLVLRRDALAESGLTMSSSGTLSYNISTNELKAENFKIEGIFSGIVQSSYADLYAAPMFILRDGIKGFWKDGQRLPIPKKTVSDYGTVTTSGYEYLSTGLDVSCSVRESKQGGFLEMKISLSDIQSYVEDLPVTSNTECSVALDMIPNKIYLLSELQRFSHVDRQGSTLFFSRDKGKSIIQVWGRIYRINSPSSVLSYPKVE